MSTRSLVRAAFPNSVAEEIGYYVYRLVDPRSGQTFYIGKGSGNRIFQHVAEAAELPDRPSLKLARIREIEASGASVEYVVHRHGLTEDEALLVESVLIDAYDELTNEQLGHTAFTRGSMSVEVLITQYDKGEATVDIPAVLLNLNRQFDRALTAEQLYQRTRGYWVMNPSRHPGVQYAMAVAFGIIREVYKIDAWSTQAVGEIVESDLRRIDSAETKSPVRSSFTGSVARDIRERFVGKSVASKAQNPVRWMNC